MYLSGGVLAQNVQEGGPRRIEEKKEGKEKGKEGRGERRKERRREASHSPEFLVL